MSDQAKPAEAPATPPADGNTTTVTPPATAEGTGGTPNPPPPKPPEKYDLKPRKDSPLLKGDVEEVEAFAKAQGLTQEQAQKMVEGREGDFDRVHTRQKEFLDRRNADWKKQAETDPEIAGADGKEFAKNVEIAHRGLKHMFGDSLSKELAISGWGNNPAVIKGFMKTAHKLGIVNDEAVSEGRSGATPPGKKSREEKLFPTHFKNKE